MKILEKDVKKLVKRLIADKVKEHGKPIYYFMPVSNGMGRHGISDFIICVNGRYLAVETKVHGKQPTARQWINLIDVIEAGGNALVIDETNLHELAKAIDDAVSTI